MTADRPVSPPPDTVTDDMVEAYDRAAWLAARGGTSAEVIRAGLEAVVPLIRAQLAAEQEAQAPIDAATTVDIVWTRPLEVAPRPPVITRVLPSPSYGTPVTYTATEGFYEDNEPVADVAAAFDAAEKGVTTRPTVAVDPADLRAVLDQDTAHYHQRPGVWDDDNPPERAGKPCVECAARGRLRAALDGRQREGR